MRVLLLTLLLLPMAAADSFTLTGAHGDIPGTPATEAAGFWNMVQTAVVDHTNQTVLNLAIPAGASFGGVSCTCTGMVRSGDLPEVTITLGPDVAAGSYTIELLSSEAAGSVFAFDAVIRMATNEVVLYAPDGAVIRSSVELDATGNRYAATDVPVDSWYVIAPAGPVTAAPESAFDFLALVVGLLGGALIWFVLVKQGIVQKRTRKQVVQTAAHTEVRHRESKETLTGRKRALMAALKELEVAKMNKELDDASYEKLKADFKKQTVTVMRALDTES